MRHLILLLALLAFSFTAQGQLYKWVDKDGKTQYTDQPPPPGAARNEKKLNIQSAPPVQPAAAKTGDKVDDKGKAGGKTGDKDKASGPKTTAEKDLDFKKRRAAEAEAEAKQQAEAKQNQEKCAQAQTSLKTYQESARLTIPDGKGGTTYADDAARQKGIDEAQKDIASFCK